jgi:hypothetical protein
VKKCLRDHARFDLRGDLYYLRTSIVHNRGIATSQVAKCKIIKWFKPDDPISLSPDTCGQSFCHCCRTGTSCSRSNSPSSIWSCKQKSPHQKQRMYINTLRLAKWLKKSAAVPPLCPIHISPS